MIVQHIVKRNSQKYPRKEPAKHHIINLVSDSDKTRLTLNPEYVVRRLRFRFTEAFFNEYDGWSCPHDKRQRDRFILRCLDEACFLTRAEFEFMLQIVQ